MTSSPPLLQVDHLKVSFKTDRGLARAVNDVSLRVDIGETLGVVGESGCGKSVTALAIMGLIPEPPGRYEGGQIWFKDRDLRTISRAALRRIRGNLISMIFQEPMTSLNPVMTCGDQIVEAVRLHLGLDRRSAWDKAIELFRQVDIPDPERRVREYPHQLSGGLRQRVMIALALSCNPALLIADEPTTALDVTIQAQVLDLIRRQQQDREMGVIMISHDLGVIAEVADRVMIMYAGEVVEEGTVEDIFHRPQHPYTIGLLAAVPNPGRQMDRLQAINGSVPSAADLPPGCPFHPRCARVVERCRSDAPLLAPLAREAVHRVRCWDVATVEPEPDEARMSG